MSSIDQLNRSVSLDGKVGDARNYLTVLARSGGDLRLARQLAAQSSSVRVRELFERDYVMTTKGAVAVAGLSDALAWYEPLATGFFASCAPFMSLARVSLTRKGRFGGVLVGFGGRHDQHQKVSQGHCNMAEPRGIGQ